MGQAYDYTCKKCHYHYPVFIGIGFSYYEFYRNKLAEISEGSYGIEWKNLLDQTPFAAIDASSVVYICSSCNRWEIGTNITLYAPNNPERIADSFNWIKAVECGEYIPYVPKWNLINNYHVLKRYYSMLQGM